MAETKEQLTKTQIERRFTAALGRALTTPRKPDDKIDPKASKPKKEKAQPLS